jgi:hypothetical protein
VSGDLVYVKREISQERRKLVRNESVGKIFQDNQVLDS